MDASDSPAMDAATAAIYERFTKLELVTLCRSHGWTGDNARTSKEELAAFAAAHGVTVDAARPAPATGNPADMLAAAMRAMMATLPASVDEARVREICRDTAGLSEKGVRDLIDAALASIPAQRLEIVRAGATVATLAGQQHQLFTKFVRALATKNNVWLAGPAGSGKTTAAEKAAEALGLPFYFNGAIDTEYKLLGFIDAQGRIVSTAFREAFTNGGVYLFDEVDASLPGATLAFQAALANGMADFPGGMVRRHKDFYCVAAANTWGLGSTTDYVGRNRLDAAFLDRFPVKFAWGYDESLELAIVNGIAPGNDSWVGFVQSARAKARTKGLKVVISPRASIGGALLLDAGFTMEETADLTVYAGLTVDQRSNLAGA